MNRAVDGCRNEPVLSDRNLGLDGLRLDLFSLVALALLLGRSEVDGIVVLILHGLFFLDGALFALGRGWSFGLGTLWGGGTTTSGGGLAVTLLELLHDSL